ncbi:hypothetical protein SAPIO_CDS6051 [Scedosporium apiospermum]|uniref:Shugoshin n=1 Tax=Pseudallescheria apiosperma TaxID=563466 RepID=A0A084G602_PSEDA|nr:uncharacterized protein SAPIO_CDS6051 [Scedosporium apiospermum]KEZ42764.1 hypothetical protein SAPIO_CDS6051 [Scedosporium apiospermum]
MARLNDPPQSADSYETLRRKLLRQNRDLARVNSTQSLKIRHLENECARMLSENLELRGQILQLEKEVENSKAQRIADHALEIKAKLEEQLVEWGSILAGLGLEPPAKRRDAVGRRATQPRTSLPKRSPRKSLRDLAKEAEARAREEGRLTPIREHRTYPRQTLDSEEIMALRSEVEAADVSGSSDIGPPPVSQFVDEDYSSIPESPTKPPTTKKTAEPEREETKEPVPTTNVVEKSEPDEAPSAATTVPTFSKPEVQSAPAPAPIKAGSKRKLGAREEPENINTTNAQIQPVTAARRKSTISKERTGGKTLKELAAMRRESRETATTPVLAPTRRPLAVKSTNEDIASPKKAVGKKGAEPDGKPIKPLKLKANKEDGPRRSTKPKNTEIIKIKEEPVLAPVETAIISPTTEPEKLAAPLDANLLSPSSPQPKSQNESNDTPPPADISWKGETSRPSRRARVPISYAEPNLRDKMRRPTKELVDAVAGEGKYRRQSSLDEEIAASESQGKRESTAGESSKRSTPAPEPERNDQVASPLAQKGDGVVNDTLPSSVVTERRKRRSSILTRDSTNFNDTMGASSNDTDDTLDTSLGSTSSLESSVDIYEFPSNSPDKGAGSAAVSETTSRKVGVATRRVSMADHTELSLEREETTKVSRKRSSIHSSRRSRAELGRIKQEDGDEGTSTVAATKDRSMRRRSTML